MARSVRLRLFELAFRSPEWRNVVRAVRQQGYAVIPGYLSGEEVDFCLSICRRSTDGIDGLDGDPYYIATAPGSLRLRHMESRHPELDYFRRHLKIAALSVCLYGKPHWPSVQYSATYDGRTNPKYVEGRADAPFGGIGHMDRWHHQLKAIFLLDDVTPENGPLTIYPGTWRPQWSGIDVYRLKKWKRKKLRNGAMPAELAQMESDNFPPHVIAKIEQDVSPISVTGKAGDLVLFDTRTVHFAKRIEKGQRRLLWFYF